MPLPLYALEKNRHESEHAPVIVFTLFMLVLSSPISAQTAGTPPQSQAETPFVSQVDLYAKIVTAVLTAIGTLFGLPAALLFFRKTRAEIRKTELEAVALAAKLSDQQPVLQDKFSAGGVAIVLNDSDSNRIIVMADPRLLGPLLILLDFVIAWIVLTLASYPIGFFLRTFHLGGIFALDDLVRIIVAAVLLVPLFREARRIRKVLRPAKLNEELPKTPA